MEGYKASKVTAMRGPLLARLLRIVKEFLRPSGYLGLKLQWESNMAGNSHTNIFVPHLCTNKEGMSWLL